jgi:hypothetical protein
VVDRLLAEAMQGDSYELEAHRTSADVIASVGRWRRDLDGSMQKTCQQVFGDVLEELGYPEAGSGADRVALGARRSPRPGLSSIGSADALPAPRAVRDR